MSAPTPTSKGTAASSGSTATKTSVAVAAGETLIVHAGWNAASGMNISSIKHGTTAMTASLGSVSNGNLRGRTYHLYFASAATANVVCTWGGTVLGSIDVWTVPGMVTDATAIVDRTKSATGTSTAPNPGTSSALRAYREVAFVVVVTNEANTSDYPDGTWDGGITAGDSSGSGDVANHSKMQTGWFKSASKSTYGLGMTGLSASVAWVAYTVTYIVQGVRFMGASTPSSIDSTATSLSTTLPSYSSAMNPIVQAVLVLKGTGAGVSGVTCGGDAMTLKQSGSNIFVYEIQGAYSGGSVVATFTGAAHKGSVLFAVAFDYVSRTIAPTYTLYTGTGTAVGPQTLTQDDYAGDWWSAICVPQGTGSPIIISPQDSYNFGGSGFTGGDAGNSDLVGLGFGDVGPWPNDSTVGGTLGTSTAWQQIVIEMNSSDAQPISVTTTVGSTAGASRVLASPRSAAPTVGSTATASRVLASPRRAAPTVGSVATASRVLASPRSAAPTVGSVAVASRVLASPRSAAPTVGSVATASRVLKSPRSAAASGASIATAARTLVSARSASASVAGSATESHVTSSPRSAAASGAGSATAARVLASPRSVAAAVTGTATAVRGNLSMARAVAALVSSIAAVTRTLVSPRSASATTAGSATASRSLSLPRAVTASLAGIATASRVLVSPRAVATMIGNVVVVKIPVIYQMALYATVHFTASVSRLVRRIVTASLRMRPIVSLPAPGGAATRSTLFVFDDQALGVRGADIGVPDQDPNFLVLNTLNPERATLWRTSAAPPATIYLDIQLAAGADVSGFAVCGLASEGAAPAVQLRSSPTSFATTVAVADQSAGYWAAQRDWVGAVAATGDRFWRVVFSGVSARFALAKVILGTSADVSYYYSAGSQFEQVIGRDRERDVDQHPVDVEYVAGHRLYRWKYNSSDATVRALMERLANQEVPFAVLDPQGNASHVWLAAPGSVPITHRMPGLWDSELAMEQMP